MTLAQGFVLTSDDDGDAPACPAIATVSKDDSWDGGAYQLGAAAAAAGRLWCDRPYFTGNPTVDWMVAKIDRVTDADGWAQIGNEQNLALEGWVGGPSAWAAFDAEVRARVQRPDRLLAMPPSPGQAGWPEWVTPVGPYAVHAYGSFDQMRGLVEWYLENTAGELCVTECNFGAGNAVDVDAWANEHLMPFLDWCATEGRVKLAAYFAWVWHGAPELPTTVDARGTAVETVIRDWRPPANGAAPWPWEGTTLTVWNLPDDPQELIDWATVLEVACVEVKTADGSSSWLGPARNLTTDYIARVRAGLPGVKLCGWSYNYCDLRTGPDATTRTPASRFGRSLSRLRGVRSWDRGDGIPEAEAAAAAAAVEALGLDGHTFDLEIECEGHEDLVSIMLDEARRLMPTTPFGAHTWAYRSGHERYPWDAIAVGVDVVRPMCYQPTWDADEMYAAGELGPWLAPLVAAPVWGITEEADTVGVLADDQDVAEAHASIGCGFWEYSGLPGQPGVVDWIAGLYPEGGAPPADPLAGLQQRTWDALDAVQALAGEWQGASWPSTAAGLAAAAEAGKTIVRSTKGER